MGIEKTIIERASVGFLKGVIRLYQWTLSPLIGRQCRFMPTCSCYAHTALDIHGLKAVRMIASRLLRCSPLSTSNTIQYDPVPEKQ